MYEKRDCRLLPFSPCIHFIEEKCVYHKWGGDSLGLPFILCKTKVITVLCRGYLRCEDLCLAQTCAQLAVTFGHHSNISKSCPGGPLCVNASSRARGPSFHSEAWHEASRLSPVCDPRHDHFPIKGKFKKP